MKLFGTIFFSFVLFNSSAQDTIRGFLYDYDTKKAISIPNSKTKSVALISNGEIGKRKIKHYKVSSNGQFSIPAADLDSLGDNITFSVTIFYEGEKFNYADFEIMNIKREIIEKLLAQVYLIPAYWTNSCGEDCFVIDNRRTFKRRVIDIVTPYISYQIKREPDKINKRVLDMKYVVDINTSIL